MKFDNVVIQEKGVTFMDKKDSSWVIFITRMSHRDGEVRKGDVHLGARLRRRKRCTHLIRIYIQ